MRAEVTGAVRLEQPQYQSAELLIAVLSRGFQVAEVPATIHKRQVGESKKGHNAIYGLRYAGVVVGTWWRDGAAARSPRPPGQPTAPPWIPAGQGSLTGRPVAACAPQTPGCGSSRDRVFLSPGAPHPWTRPG